MSTRAVKEVEQACEYLRGVGVSVGDVVLCDDSIYIYLGVAALEHGPVAVIRGEDKEHLRVVHYSRLTKAGT